MRCFSSSFRPILVVLGICLPVFLTACSASGIRPEAPAKPRQFASLEPQEDLPLSVGALSPRAIEAGQCAMFLWSNQGEARFVFFAESGGRAEMRLNGIERSFRRTAAEGDSAFGQFSRQRFEDEGWSLALTIEVEARKGLLGGAVIPRGALRVSEPEGWERVLPVAGLIACKGR